MAEDSQETRHSCQFSTRNPPTRGGKDEFEAPRKVAARGRTDRRDCLRYGRGMLCHDPHLRTTNCAEVKGNRSEGRLNRSHSLLYTTISLRQSVAVQHDKQCGAAY